MAKRRSERREEGHIEKDISDPAIQALRTALRVGPLAWGQRRDDDQQERN
jgi:hypothetical protein